MGGSSHQGCGGSILEKREKIVEEARDDTEPPKNSNGREGKKNVAQNSGAADSRAGVQELPKREGRKERNGKGEKNADPCGITKSRKPGDVVEKQPVQEEIISKGKEDCECRRSPQKQHERVFAAKAERKSCQQKRKNAEVHTGFPEVPICSRPPIRITLCACGSKELWEEECDQL